MSELRPLQVGEKVRIIDTGSLIDRVVADDLGDGYYRIKSEWYASSSDIENRDHLFAADENERLIEALEDEIACAGQTIKQLVKA